MTNEEFKMILDQQMQDIKKLERKCDDIIAEFSKTLKDYTYLPLSVYEWEGIIMTILEGQIFVEEKHNQFSVNQKIEFAPIDIKARTVKNLDVFKKQIIKDLKMKFEEATENFNQIKKD